MTSFKLRDYQEKSLFLIKKAYIDGKRKILLWLATGGGKGIIYIKLVEGFLKKNQKVLLVMRRKQLVIQTRDRFIKNGYSPSIIMSGQKGFDSNNPFQIASIDTLARRDLSFLSGFNVIVDEGHDATSHSYEKVLDEIAAPLEIALTATPFLNGNKPHKRWDACVKPIEPYELMKRGFLVPCALFIPHKIDLSEIKTRAGDYASNELSEKMSKLDIVGDIVSDYKKLGENKPFICFTVDKGHSAVLSKEFNEQGIKVMQADESTPQKERDIILEKFRKKEIQGLINVNIFSTGVDLPMAEVGIMARPTRSETLYIQQIGRLLRPFRICGRCKSEYDNSPECPQCGHDKPSYIKKRAIIIDSGDNQSRLGHPYDDRWPAMNEDDKKEKAKKEPALTKTCKHCFYVYLAELKKCPNCTQEMELPENLYETKKGEIVPYDEYSEISKAFYELERSQIIGGFKPNYKFFKLYERFGEKCMKYQEEFNIPKWVPKIVKKNKEKESGLENKLYKE